MTTRLLAHRLDAFVIAGRVELDPGFTGQVWEARARALTDGAAVVTTPRGELLAVAARQPPTRTVCREARWSVVVEPESDATEDEGPGWSVVVECRGQWLATVSPADAWRAVLAFLKTLGRVYATRCRRLDMAADFENFELLADDHARMLVPRRGRLATYAELDDEERPDPAPGVVYRRGRRVTGWTVCPGGAVMLRVYDKTEQLGVTGDNQRADAEKERWRAAGWTEGRVTRVEYQFRGEALKELGGLRDQPERLASELAGLWSYATRWARLIDPTTDERPCRCELDPRWVAVRAVVWDGDAKPPARVRTRGRAGWRQAWGVACSYLGRDVARIIPASDGELAGELGAALVERLADDLARVAREDSSVLRRLRARLVETWIEAESSPASVDAGDPPD